jgi:hypothetical protein
VRGGAGTARAAVDGLDARPWMSLRLGSSFFLFFYFINNGEQLVCLGKCMIYRDLLGEADGLPASGNHFCPPHLNLL